MRRVYRPVDTTTGEIDYDLTVMLDAEDLAEQGMAEGYDLVREAVREHGVDLADLIERVDEEAGTYSVESLGRSYVIHRSLDDQQSWANATVALFDIVNRQLAEYPMSLYAINGGNDLFGILLTADEAARAGAALANPTDRPYLPVAEPPWFGQPH